MTWLSFLFVNLLHALGPHHLEKFGAALKRKAFHYVGSGHIQHVFVYLSLKSINKNTLLNVLINFLANTGENLKNKWDHKVKHYEHGANPEQDKEKPRPVVAHHCAIHVTRDVPIVYDHHMEQSDQTRRKVIKIHQVPKWRCREITRLRRVGGNKTTKKKHPKFSENKEESVQGEAHREKRIVEFYKGADDHLELS